MLYKDIDISFVIPIYNEGGILKQQVNTIIDRCAKNKLNYEIILVDSNSTDGTFKICQNLAENNSCIKSFRIEKTDYGLTLRQGFLNAMGNFIVNFDIDYYDINFALQALALAPFGYDIIVASKNLRLSNDTRALIRRFISSVFKYILYYAFGLRVSDTHGIKAWRNDPKFKALIAQTVNNKEIFDTELIIRSQYSGRKLLELPIEVREIRQSVTGIMSRALRGFVQIVKLWFLLCLKQRK